VTNRSRRLRSALVATGLLVGLLVPALDGGASAGVPPGSIELTAQTPTVGTTGQFSFSLKVSSKLAPSDLAIGLELYTQLPSRYYYGISETNIELPSEGCLDELGPFPLDGLVGVSTTGVVTYHLRVEPGAGASTCSTSGKVLQLSCLPGNCDGVYPLRISLVDIENGSTVDSFTTHVIYTADVTSSDPLEVGLALPIGVPLALAPSGRPTLTSGQLADLVTVLGALAHHTSVRLSLSVSPSTVLALQRSTRPNAKAALKLLGKLLRTTHSVELLSAPFVPLDVASLVASGLGDDLAAQFNRGRAALANAFPARTVVSGPYLAPDPLDTNAISDLERSCVSEFVVPEANVPAFGGFALTPSEPFELQPSGTCSAGRRIVPEAVDADTVLAGEFSVGHGGPTLAAENLIGDLAQVYFERPNADMPREVVVAPKAVPADSAFLGAVFAGLRSNPILESETLAAVFSSVVLGSNGNPRAAALSAGSLPKNLPAGAIRAARNLVGAITSVDPTNSTVDQRLHDSIFLAESTGATNASRAPYLAAPSAELREIAAEIQVSARTYTLTARTGKIPITILLSTPGGGGPLHVVVRLQSSGAIEFLSGSRQSVELSSKNFVDVVQVSTRTSGAFPLTVELLTATGAVELDHGTLLVRSTAVSGVAIALSVAALLVLLAWWVRSGLRRRGRHQRSHSRPEELVGAEP